MMVTAGAAANVQTTSFLGNSVVNYGDFGGAIFHDYVRFWKNPELACCRCRCCLSCERCNDLC